MRRRGRKSQVRYYPSKGGYFVTYEGIKYPLGYGPDDAPDGPVYSTAVKKYLSIIRGEEVESVGVQPSDTVGAVVRRWMTERKKTGGASCYLEPFLKLSGGNKLADLKQHHVTSWLSGQTSWNPTTKATAVRLLKTALSWNLSEGHTKINPLSALKAKNLDGVEDMARGADFRLPDELVSLLISTARGRFRDYLLMLARTGCRPGEAANAQPMHYDRANKRLIFRAQPRSGYVHKTAKKTKKDRLIYLSAEVIEIIERNLAAGCEYLFPTRQRDKEGKYRRYSKDNLGTAMWKLRHQPVIKQYLRAHGIEETKVICYALRHTYCSRAIDRKVNIAQLAVLVGTSVRMLEKHYCHHDGDVLRSVFDEISQQ